MRHPESVAFVLGAGSSVPYGLPTGAELTRQAVEFLSANARSRYDDFLEQYEELNNFNSLAKLLTRSRTPTLDHYIQHNEKYSQELKMAIAGCLWNREGQALDVDSLPEDDWIAWLYHEYLDSPSPDDFIGMPVCFLTFNYDRLPLALIATMMSNTHMVPIEKCLNAIRQAPNEFSHCLETRFLHIHGELNAPLSKYRNPSNGSIDASRLSNKNTDMEILSESENTFKVLAEKILVIHEDTSEVNAARSRARRALTCSDHVVFLGFGYHSANIKRLGIMKPDMSDILPERSRIGGTGFSIRGNARDTLASKLPSQFVLGEEDESCREFLDRFLSELGATHR